MDSEPATIPLLQLDPFGDAFLADPYSYHGLIRDAGPVVRLMPLGVFAMARFGEVEAALRDWQTFSSARGVGLADFAVDQPWRPPSLLLEADPPLHDRTRALMNRIVSPAALKALRPAWQAKADALVEELAAQRRFDAVTDLAERFPLAVFPETIGLPDGGEPYLIPYGTLTFNSFGPRNQVLEASSAAAVEAVAWVAQACRREQLKPGGWGQAIYAAADRGECTEDEAERLTRSFLAAGVDTTVNGIANMVHAFARFPDEWDRLRADPSLARRAFEESLRWDGTVQIFFRTTTRDVDVGETVVPEGSKVILFLAAANRDPRKWRDPDRFDIGRQTSGHVGFGFGIHQCLGQMVARLEAEVVLAALIPRIARFRLGIPERRLNNTLHAFARLPVEIEPA